jgi:hypothetical protein
MDMAKENPLFLNELRNNAAVCFFVAVTRILFGWLRVSRYHVGMTLFTDDGDFCPFRRLINVASASDEHSCVFSVQFKFARLTEKQNRRASVIPMLLIAGFPGFRGMVFSTNSDDGRWMGLYEWASREHLENYRCSWVYRMMNRRAVPGSIDERLHMERNLAAAIQRLLIAPNLRPDGGRRATAS